ncbi:MAG: trypco2 family protein [Pseudonocardia sp.]
MPEVPLSDAIASLRVELQQALEEGAGKPLQFLVSALDVELEVVVTAKASGKASAGLWTVITAEAGAEHSRSRTHRIKLSLTPQTADGERLKIADSLDDRPR